MFYVAAQETQQLRIVLALFGNMYLMQQSFLRQFSSQVPRKMTRSLRSHDPELSTLPSNFKRRHCAAKR